MKNHSGTQEVKNSICEVYGEVNCEQIGSKRQNCGFTCDPGSILSSFRAFRDES